MPPARPEGILQNPRVRRHAVVTALAEGLERLQQHAGSRADFTRPAIVAASGGADSTALAIAAAVLSTRQRSPLPAPLIAHVHHHLRGPEADADADATERLAARLDLPFERLDVHPSTAGNLSARAREARHHALASLAARIDRPTVLLGHHADDQLETTLMDLARGTAPASAGMPAARPVRSDALDLDAAPDPALGPWIVRPLLQVRRHALEDLCRAAGWSWREDSSNQNPDRTRTTVRTRLAPLVETIGPGAAVRVAASVERIVAAEPVPIAASGDLSWDRATLATLSPPAIGEVLRAAALVLAPRSRDALTRRVLAPVVRAIADDRSDPRCFDWPGELTVRVDRRTAAIRRTCTSATSEAESGLSGRNPDTSR